MKKKRIPIPKDLAADVMFAADRTCCVCRENGKAIQIHHIDGDPSNNTPENLVVLCLEHHNQTQITGGFGRKLDAPLVARYRDEWLKDVKGRRTQQANERAVKRDGEEISIIPQRNSLIYFWVDANAFAKRYVVEDGTQLINYFFENVSTSRVLCLVDSLNEVYAVMAKKLRKPDGVLIQPDHDQAIEKFEAEVVNHAEVVQLEATPNQKIAARKLIAAHAINSSDALILQCALDEANNLRAAGGDLVLVCSDKRLVRAAKREELRTFNPENDSQEHLDIFINPV